MHFNTNVISAMMLSSMVGASSRGHSGRYRIHRIDPHTTGVSGSLALCHDQGRTRGTNQGNGRGARPQDRSVRGAFYPALYLQSSICARASLAPKPRPKTATMPLQGCTHSGRIGTGTEVAEGVEYLDLCRVGNRGRAWRSMAVLGWALLIFKLRRTTQKSPDCVAGYSV